MKGIERLDQIANVHRLKSIGVKADALLTRGEQNIMKLNEQRIQAQMRGKKKVNL